MIIPIKIIPTPSPCRICAHSPDNLNPASLLRMFRRSTQPISPYCGCRSCSCCCCAYCIYSILQYNVDSIQYNTIQYNTHINIQISNYCIWQLSCLQPTIRLLDSFISTRTFGFTIYTYTTLSSRFVFQQLINCCVFFLFKSIGLISLIICCFDSEQFKLYLDSSYLLNVMLSIVNLFSPSYYQFYSSLFYSYQCYFYQCNYCSYSCQYSPSYSYLCFPSSSPSPSSSSPQLPSPSYSSFPSSSPTSSSYSSLLSDILYNYIIWLYYHFCYRLQLPRHTPLTSTNGLRRQSAMRATSYSPSLRRFRCASRARRAACNAATPTCAWPASRATSTTRLHQHANGVQQVICTYDIHHSKNYCISCKKGKVLMECEKCQPGFILQDDGECKACSNQCVDCATTTSCRTCGDGFYELEGECQYCVYGCKECLAYPQCESCIDGYYLSGTSCVHCPNGCTKCESEISCSECHSSFLLKERLCERCLENCEYCNPESGGCYQCYEGYMLSEDKKQCIGCPEQLCIECELDDLNYCLKCSTGFDAVDGLCVQCLNNCAKCSAYVTCEKCLDGYFIGEETMCYACILNCKTCKDETTCDVCYDGYYADGTCKLCQQFCDKCNNSFICDQCQSGYYFNGFECVQCSLGCEHCNYDGQCLKCTYGYYVEKGECVGCREDVCQCSVLQKLVEGGASVLVMAVTMVTLSLMI